jgi:hypothetical protein
MSERATFDATVESSELAVATDFSSGSKVLLVTFGGFAGGVGIPPFEFFRMASDLGVCKVFVRDLAQAMYHRSLPGIGGGVDGIVEFVKRQATEHGIERTVVLGNSGGGYASLLFGALLDADVAYAFSPVTFIGPVARTLHRDRRAPKLFWRSVFSRNATPSYYDLRNVFAGHGRGTRFHIYYCPNGPWGRLDALHANRMAHFPNVELHVVEEGGHYIVKVLRDEGKLAEILRDSLLP